MYALSARWSAAKTKLKTTVQVWPGMRQELSFTLAIIQTQEWTAVLKKQFQFPNCTPLRHTFLCRMNSGDWSIPHPKI